MADDTMQDAATPDVQPETGRDDGGKGGKEAVLADLAKERSAKKAAEKQLTELSKRLQEFEDRDKSEAQRLTEERDALKAERDLTRIEATKLRLGIRYKLSEDDLDFLGVGTDEEMESRAKRLSEKTVTPARGAVDQGVKGDRKEALGKPDMNALIRAAARGGDPF